MPATLTYPGVYIEEISSGVRTITGVATSITAFIGRALRGPTDDAITINNYGDFEHIFGGLWVDSTLGYAVRDFYLNGGSQAIIVRLNREETGASAKLAKAVIDANGLILEAAYPGFWGNNLRARVEDVDSAVASDIRKILGITDVDALFDLRVYDKITGVEEQFRNVTIVESIRKVDRLLAHESSLVRVKTLVAPTAHVIKTPAGKTVWENDTTSDGVADPNKASDGLDLTQNEFIGSGKDTNKQGLYSLEKADLFNILCIPPCLKTGEADVASLVGTAASYCELRRAMLLVDPPSTWTSKDAAKAGLPNIGTKSKNAAVFFPRLTQQNSLHNNQMEDFVPCGAIAGIFARTDTQRGVWKAPAGLDATIIGVPQLSVPLTDAENGELNPLGINCLRTMPAAGRIVWGSRTLQGDDRLASEWKYIPVRRTTLFIEESLYRGTQWVVFEPNDEPLWAQIRLNLGAFMHNLFRQGAFQGKTPKEAYFIKCDAETTNQTDINSGIVNIVVGFAPLKPAEFVVIKLQQMAGQIEV